MAEQTGAGGGSPRPAAAAGSQPDGPVPRDPLREAGSALISILHADDVTDEASTEPMRIDPDGQKKILYNTAADANNSRPRFPGPRLRTRNSFPSHPLPII